MSATYLLGVDIGGTFSEIGLIDDSGGIRLKDCPPPPTAQSPPPPQQP